MRFGIRECANIVFRAKQDVKIGEKTFKKGQPVLYIDSATTSSEEQSTTTTYAQGGRGNVRLIGWEGEKTLTFTVEDALLSPIGYSILSGAGLFKGYNNGQDVHFHMTSNVIVKDDKVNLKGILDKFNNAKICLEDAPIFVMPLDDDNDLDGSLYQGKITEGTEAGELLLPGYGTQFPKNATAMIDYYIDLPGANVYEADITPDTFAGYYYVEADTLFRRQSDGVDLPANLTFPNVKLQSNFTITMAGSGDPSTFTFTFDAFPGYTYFDNTKKVLSVLQVVEDSNAVAEADHPVMLHDASADEGDVMGDDSNTLEPKN